MSASSYFKDMRQFLQNSRRDKRLTPATQLMYRVLVELANANCWLYPFAASNAELKEITHITSDREITQIKQRLKNLKYIYYEGSPSRYIIYSPIAQEEARKVARSRVPHTPQYNTIIRKHDKKKKQRKEEREEKGHEKLQHRGYDWESDPELEEFI